MLIHSASARSAIRLGFVPLNDCAPLAVAHELGIFETYGLKVHLTRQPGWASIRDMLYCDQLDAAHSIAGLAFLFALGIRQQKRDITVPLFLSAQGNAITLSHQLPSGLIGQGSGLATYLNRHWKRARPLTLAATHPYSSHHMLLRQWLEKNGIAADDSRVDIIFLPPPVMASALASGQIDGFCVGDPWNSEVVLSDLGWCPCVSADIARAHPEKALIINETMMKERADDVTQLSAALLEACHVCQREDFREELIQILHHPRYTGVSKSILRNGIGTAFRCPISQIEAHDFLIFAGASINTPSQEKATWLLNGLRDAGLIPETTMGSITRIFRQDLYLHAERLMQQANAQPMSANAARNSAAC